MRTRTNKVIRGRGEKGNWRKFLREYVKEKEREIDRKRERERERESGRERKFMYLCYEPFFAL